MMGDEYEGIAERYDLFGPPFGEHDPAERAFFQRLFAANGVRTVLDCACGTGRHLGLFHDLGLEVVGSDLSPSMLARASENLAAAGWQIPLHRLDYRALPPALEQRFDAVVCLSSSILHMPDEAELLRALRSMHGVLRRGGILILTQGTTDRQWREKPRFIPAVNRPDFSRILAIDYAGAGARYHLLDIWHSEERREFRVWSVDYPRVWLKGEQESALLAAGFREVEALGGYDGAPYDEQTSGRLILVALK